ncbi:MAG TPA: hypothetical protein VHM67_02645 [Gemmatimonadaceae bacterium]|nr:hypothetical protein [Gemmatimonadaceae bacterium]
MLVVTIWWIVSFAVLFAAPISWPARFALLIPLIYIGMFVQFLLVVRYPLRPAVARFDGSDDEVGAGELSFLGRTTLRLRESGFRPIAELVFQPPARGPVRQRTLGAILDDEAGRSRAWVSATQITAPRRRTAVEMVSVSSRYADGSIRMTINAPPSRVDPGDSARRVCVYLPDVVDASMVARVHGALLAGDARGTANELTPVNDPVELGAKMYVELFEALAADGYLSREASAGEYRLTLRGALRLVGRAMPPFSTLRDRRARREAATLLASLGVAGTPPRT